MNNKILEQIWKSHLKALDNNNIAEAERLFNFLEKLCNKENQANY